MYYSENACNITQFDCETNNSIIKLEDSSLYFIELTRKINLFATLIIIAIGLIGNCLIIFVFSQNRFRINSSNVYLLCLAIIDNLFLIVHLFEDSIREYQEIYPNSQSIFNQFIFTLNVFDKTQFSCLLINYLRHFLRFVSAYIIVAFTVQRLSNKFKTKKSAWNILSLLIALSFVFNIWVLFVFRIQNNKQNKKYCDISKDLEDEYFVITIVYTSFIMLIPILTVFICNILIIFKTNKADSLKNRTSIATSLNTRTVITGFLPTARVCTKSEVSFKLRPYYVTSRLGVNKIHRRIQNSNNLTQLLVLVSFSFAFLNIPYLVSWLLFFYEVSFNKIDTFKKYYFHVFQII